jgi:glycosyltransferase involved in cell wall biosynthesis
MSAPTVAVVVPVYNRPRLVLEALASIAVQTHPPQSVVVVDDGSTDDTAESITRWVDATRPAVPMRLVRQANGGVSAARNRGVGEAGPCDVLAFLDSDDAWPADYLQRMVPGLWSVPGAVAASCDLHFIDSHLKVDMVLEAKCLEGRASAVLFSRYCPTPSCTVVRCEHFHAVGGFDRRYQGIEDHDLFLRLSLRGPWVFVPGTPITYRRGTQHQEPGPPHLNERMATTEQTLAHIQMLERFLHEHGGAAVVPFYRRGYHLARLYHRLGKMYQRDDRREAARDSYRAAVRQFPLYYRSLMKLLRMSLG